MKGDLSLYSDTPGESTVHRILRRHTDYTVLMEDDTTVTALPAFGHSNVKPRHCTFSINTFLANGRNWSSVWHQGIRCNLT